MTNSFEIRCFSVEFSSDFYILFILKDGKFCENRNEGSPAVWIVDVCDGETKFSSVPNVGRLENILKEPAKLIADERCEQVRKMNPNVIKPS